MDDKKIIITGGAGYIGQCTAALLIKEGFTPVAIDNFSTSHKNPRLEFEVIEADLTDLAATRKAFAKVGKAQGVIHFAAFALVPESCEKPELYFRNNLLATVNAAEAAVENKIESFVHSSSCTVYGIPKAVPIPESAELDPLSPYGEAKLSSERILNQYRRYKNLNVLHLRYFNPAGALSFNGQWFGEAHEPETHVIPNLVKAALTGKPFFLFGNDYSTADGTCVRDYIHIEDLASAHLAALKYVRTQKTTAVPCINIGTGAGISVLELVRSAEQVLKVKVNLQMAPRRSGDPAALVADTTLATRLLNWRAKLSVGEMIASHSRFISK